MSPLAVESRWERLPQVPGGMPLFVAAPAGAGPYPGLVCFQTLPGINAQLQQTAERIAAEGFVVAVPQLYHRTSDVLAYRMPDEQDAAMAAWANVDYYGIAADSRVALNFLASLPAVDPGRLGAIGYCIGGGGAFLTACFNADVKATVVAYGTELVSPKATPGRPVSPLALADRIQGSMLWLSASADRFVPPDHVAEIERTMRRLGKPFDAHIYDADTVAGHAFFSADQPRFYHPAAADWGWKLKLRFLKDRLAVA